MSKCVQLQMTNAIASECQALTANWRDDVGRSGTLDAVKGFWGTMCGELAGLTAGPSWSPVAPQFGSLALKPKENLRLSEATAKWPRRFQARQFCAARCLPLLSPLSPGNCWFGELESALPVAQSCLLSTRAHRSRTHFQRKLRLV